MLGPGVDQVTALRLAEDLRLTRPTPRRRPGPAADRHRRPRRRPAGRGARGRRCPRPVRPDTRPYAVPGSSPVRCGTTPTPPGAGRARPARPGAHRLLREGRLRQDDRGDQPGGRAGGPAASARWCLVDLDLAFGDVAIALQLFPSHTIADAIPLGDTLDAQGVAGLLTPHSPGLTTLVAPLEPGVASSIPAELVGRILDVCGSSTTSSSWTPRRPSTTRCSRRSTAATSSPCSPRWTSRP